MTMDFTPSNPFDEVPLDPQDVELRGPDLNEEMRVGNLCGALLHSEAYKRIMSAMRESVALAFTMTPIRDTDGLVYLRIMQKVLDDFDSLLRDAVETGTLSAHQLTEMQREFKESLEMKPLQREKP